LATVETPCLAMCLKGVFAQSVRFMLTLKTTLAGTMRNRLRQAGCKGMKKPRGHALGVAFPGPGKLTPLEDELRRLCAENKRLAAERDILKKAT
jgi:hypothetical protein